MSNLDFKLWLSADKLRFFLIASKETFLAGDYCIHSLKGEEVIVDLMSIVKNEVTEAEAREWAKEVLGQALGELREAIDEKLADWRAKLDDFNKAPVTEDNTLTPNAASTLFDLLKRIPGVLDKSLSGDDNRVGEAKDTMAGLQRRLKESGIDLDERFTNFPERLADLRREFDRELAEKSEKKNEPPPD